MATSLEPCRICNGPVTIVQVTDQRSAGSALVERRTCANSECRMNGPKSQRKFSDKV